MSVMNNEITWQIENMEKLLSKKVDMLHDLNFKYADIFCQLSERNQKLVMERNNELKESIIVFSERIRSLKDTVGLLV